MPSAPPVPTSVPVEGGDLALATWGDGPRTVLAAHGITSSAYAWPAVARALPDDWRLVAPDLRGRGRSRDLPGPSRLVRHAADLCTVAESLGADGELVLAGHSMGAYVASLAARARPELFCRVVLVDGGVPLPLPPGTDPDEALAATLGPALERLARTYPDVDTYVEVFREHPALGPHWNDVVADYARYDALETRDGVRSRCREELVRDDGRDLLLSSGELDAALRGQTLPTHLLVAPGGMFGDPPGLLPVDAVERYAAEVDRLSVETVEGSNHYTILLDPSGAARVAAAITAS